MTIAPCISDFTKSEIRDVLNEIRHPFSVAVWGSTNEFNIGGIIRTCHNFLVKEIHLIEVEWFYKKGALSTFKYEKDNIVRWPSLDLFLESYRDKNLIAFERRYDLKTEDLRSFEWPNNPIMFLGSEKNGVPQLILDKCKNIVSIPIVGLNNDFNITVACGIGLYDWYSKFSLNE